MAPITSLYFINQTNELHHKKEHVNIYLVTQSSIRAVGQTLAK